MCKMCNIPEREPLSIDRVTLTIMKEFMTIFKDYAGEYPCRRCVDNYSTAYRQRNGSPDTFILKNMMRSYSRNFTLLERKRAKKVFTEQAEITQTTVGRALRKVYNADTGAVSYMVKKAINKKKIAKTFKTLEEAIQYRNILDTIPSTKFSPRFIPKMKKITEGIYSKTIDSPDGVIVRFRVTWEGKGIHKEKLVDTLEEAKQLRKEKSWVKV